MALAGRAFAAPVYPSRPVEDPWAACAQAIASPERDEGIPRHLLTAISLAESGRWNGERRATFAWPWTVNAEGQGQFFPTKAQAVAAARALRARGVSSIDVGCMQINLHHHRDAFADLEEAFDPAANARYAARFLRDLFAETGSWHEAAGRYHSATPEFKGPYQLKVANLWNAQRRTAGETAESGSPGPVVPAVATRRDPTPRWTKPARPIGRIARTDEGVPEQDQPSANRSLTQRGAIPLVLRRTADEVRQLEWRYGVRDLSSSRRAGAESLRRPAAASLLRTTGLALGVSRPSARILAGTRLVGRSIRFAAARPLVSQMASSSLVSE